MPRDRTLCSSSSSSSFICVGLGSDKPDTDRDRERQREREGNERLSLCGSARVCEKTEKKKEREEKKTQTNAFAAQKNLGESPETLDTNTRARSFPPLARRRFSLREFHLARFSRERSRALFFFSIKSCSTRKARRESEGTTREEFFCRKI